MPTSCWGYSRTKAATSSLLMSGPWGPHQAARRPRRTPPSSMARSVALKGISRVRRSSPSQRRSDAKYGSARKRGVRCCIHTSTMVGGRSITSLPSGQGRRVRPVTLLGDGAKGLSDRQHLVRVQGGLGQLHGDQRPSAAVMRQDHRSTRSRWSASRQTEPTMPLPVRSELPGHRMGSRRNMHDSTDWGCFRKHRPKSARGSDRPYAGSNQKALLRSRCAAPLYRGSSGTQTSVRRSSGATSWGELR